MHYGFLSILVMEELLLNLFSTWNIFMNITNEKYFKNENIHSYYYSWASV